MRAVMETVAMTRASQRRYGARGLTFNALHPGIIPGTRFGRGNAGVDTRPSRAPFGLKSTPAEAEARGGDSPVEPFDAAFAEVQRAAIPPARRW